MKFRNQAVSALFLVLTLVLTAPVRPAEGFTFYEQRSPVPSTLPQLKAQPHQAILDLSGAWECRVGDEGDYSPGWIPGAFDNGETVVSYRRTFTLADSLKPMYFELVVPEIHYAVEVWVNGSFVTSFTGSHLGFTCDIPRERLRFGSSNEVTLRVSNRLSPRKTLPVRSQVLQPANYGGVFSGVYLRGTPSWAIEDASLVSEVADDSTAIRVSAQIHVAQHGPLAASADSSGRIPSEVRLYVALRDSGGKVLSEARSEPLTRGGSESFQTVMPMPRFGASLWSPARPVCYFMTTSLVAGSDTLHRISRTVGFKSVKIRNGHVMVNGQRLRVRGLDYVPEGPRGARAIAVSTIREDLARMRDLGVNVIRVPFSPPPPELLTLCDEMGLLVLVEEGLDWIPSDVLAKSAYRNLVQHSTERMVLSYRDHVSVLAWGLGSQLNWRDPATQAFSQWLYQTVKGLDGALCYVETENPASAAGLADFVLISLRPDSEALKLDKAGAGSMPVIVSRVQKLAAMEDPDRSQTSAGIVNQAEYLIREVLAIEATDNLDGYLIHAYSDYHGSSPLLAQPNRPDPFLLSFGIVGLDRQERIAFSRLRELAHTGQTSPPVPAGTPEQAPVAFPAIGLAALVALSIELRRNNVFRQNLKRVFLHAHGFYSDLRYRRFLHTAQPLLLWFLEAVTLSLLLSSLLYMYRNSFALDYYLTHFFPWPHLKGQLINLIWNPVQLIAFFTAIFMGLILVQTLLVQVISLLFREHVDFWQSANYVIWSFSALLYLLPIAVVFYRAVEVPSFAQVAFFGVLIGLVWSFIRLLTALRTGFGATPWRIYVTVLGVGAVIATVVLVLLENRLGTLTYLRFFHDVFMSR
ncbi:MAG TPA: glycoside hydrolase family 2 TIM barrel-domain containing protein [bacterium]|jgi:hypothetical protein